MVDCMIICIGTIGRGIVATQGEYALRMPAVAFTAVSDLEPTA